MIRWDWYQSTVLVSEPEKSGLVAALLKAWPLSDLAPAKNLNGYHFGAAIKRGDRVLCHLCWGGNPGVNCKSTSEESGTLAAALKSFGGGHLPTRVDACEDWEEDGLFDDLSKALIGYALEKRLVIKQEGDWVRGESRTLYLGSPASPVRLMLYEKGYEQGGEAPRNWVRLEVKVRPNRLHRASVAGWCPEDAFGASWVPEALQCLGWDHLVRRSVGTIWRQSDADRARAALLKQYGAILAQWATDVGGWDSLGPAMRKTLLETV